MYVTLRLTYGRENEYIIIQRFKFAKLFLYGLLHRLMTTDEYYI